MESMLSALSLRSLPLTNAQIEAQSANASDKFFDFFPGRGLAESSRRLAASGRK
jgi:hypothetical protein